MGKQLSRALETRPSGSGTHSKNARVARRVARAGLTTGGSSDDTMDDLWLKPFFRRLCSFSLSRLVDSCALTSHFHTCHILVLGSAISNLTPSSQLPKPVHTSHLYPAIPLTTHIHIIQYTTHASILFCISLFFTLLYYSRRVTSICPPFFIPVCSDRFALILFVFCFPCCRIVSVSSALALVTSSICVLPLYLYLPLRHYLLSGIAILLEYIGHNTSYRARNATPL